MEEGLVGKERFFRQACRGRGCGAAPSGKEPGHLTPPSGQGHGERLCLRRQAHVIRAGLIADRAGEAGLHFAPADDRLHEVHLAAVLVRADAGRRVMEVDHLAGLLCLALDPEQGARG